MTKLPTTPAPQNQQRSIATEPQGLCISLFVRQHSRQHLLVRVIKQNLLLPCDRQQRSPRTRRHSRHRCRPRRHPNRLKQYVLRHRHRPFRLPTRHSNRQIHLRLVRLPRQTGLRFKQSSVDPLHHHLNVRCTQRRAFRRHEWLLFFSRRRP